MANPTPALLREFAKGSVSRETPGPRDRDSTTTIGSITNFNIPQRESQSDAKRLAELRASIQQAANGWTPPGSIEAISTPSTNKL